MESSSLFDIGQSFFQSTHTQVTFIYSIRFSSLPWPLYAVQVNAPASLLSMFVIVSTFPSCTTPVLPWLPGFSFVQVIFGSTPLNPSQINYKLLPSKIVGLIPLILSELRAIKKSQVKFKNN